MKILISTQAIFAGTRYDKQAAKILVDSGLYDEAQANSIIDALFHQDLHAYVHAPNWLEKYLKGIARMMIEEGNGSQDGVSRFIEHSVNTFDQFLTYVRNNRDKLGGTTFDSQFINEWSYQDVVDFLDELYAARDQQSAEELAAMEFGATDYELVPIESYEQMHAMFGGHWTGDGSSDKYAGGGGTAWCHANNPNTYQSWTDKGKFFVLMNKNFKDIPFNYVSNLENPKDEYGNSLIAILVDWFTGKLLNATLRCNHVGVTSSPDNQYDTYAELSKIAGFNVEQEVYSTLPGMENMVEYNSPSFDVGDKINVPIGGKGIFSAVAVKEVPDGMMFVFEQELGRVAMAEMNVYLESLSDMFPPELQNRLLELRLPTASEVFSNCDSPKEWEDCISDGVLAEGEQIPYFISAENRGGVDIYEWWTSTENVWYTKTMWDRSNCNYYVTVIGPRSPLRLGGADEAPESATYGSVRPLFTLKNL